jgi:hypothetical protein
MANVALRDVVAVMRSLVSDVDEASVSDELWRVLGEVLSPRLRQRAVGVDDDDLAFVAHWGIELGSIASPRYRSGRIVTI